MSYKKLIGGCMLFCTLGLTVFAESDSSPKTSGDSNSGYEAVEFYDFDLEINYDADTRKAHVSWDDFPAGKDFKWYKLLYSTSNSNLVYPDQSAIFVGTQRANQLNHYFYLKDTETHYVRICAITEDPDEWNKGRYCSEVQKIVLDDFDDEDKPTMCTMEYAPVCGKKSNGEYHTFSNKCMMNAEGAKYMYSGTCELEEPKPKACTREYVPVCGKKNGEKHTFSNKCMMQAENAMYLYSGKCEQEVEEEDEISYQMSLKIKKLLKEFIAKLEERGYSDEKIVATIDAVMERLKELGKQDKYRAIVNYMIDILQEYREEYEDDFGILEDIFSDY